MKSNTTHAAGIGRSWKWNGNYTLAKTLYEEYRNRLR